MSEPTKYASTTKARNEAAAEIERMAADIATTGRVFNGMFPPFIGSDNEGWRIETIDEDGYTWEHDAPTLDAAYLAAMHWPSTPPPF